MVLPGFLAELKHRNVYRAAVAYAAVGWALLEPSPAISDSATISWTVNYSRNPTRYLIYTFTNLGNTTQLVEATMRPIFFLLFLINTHAFANDGVPMHQYSRGHWGVEVMINESISYPFIIDTGAQEAIFPSSLAEALDKDIDSLPELIVQGTAGEKRVKKLTLDSMSIGGQSVTDISGVVMDLPWRADDYNNPGVLPYTFLNRFMPKFDLVNNRLILLPKSDSKVLSKGQFTEIPFELKLGSFISVELDINNQKVAATLDSGAGNRLDMNWLAAESMGVDRQKNNLLEGDPIHGAGGKKVKSLAYPNATISINEIALKNRTINIADIPVLKLLHGDTPAANFGLGVFGARQLIIDYDNQRLLLSSEAEN
jgi:predicted aspartyl protease